MTRRRAVKGVLFGGLLAGLVAATGGLVLAGGDGVAPSADPQPVSAPTPYDAGAPGSADVPLANAALTAQDVVHVHPASRGDARTALADGDTVAFTLTIDGATTEITTAADTLADALAEAGVVLGWEDRVSGDLTAAPVAGEDVHVARATTGYVTEQVITPHTTEQRGTSELLVGESRVVQEGVDGDARTTSTVTYIDGVEASRTTLVRTELSQAVTEIVEVGTRKPVVVAAPAAPRTTSGSSSSGTTAAAPAPTGSAVADTSGNRGLGRELMLQYGFAEDQWSCLEALWTRESGWNHLSKNRSSGAYGIPQSLPGSKMASAGADWETNPATQIQWGLGYIAGRYSTPCGAWAAFQSKGWY